MPQYLAQINGQSFTLSKEEAHHLKVARYSAGQEIKIFDGCGKKYLARLTSAQGGKIIKTLPSRALKRNITLYFSAISRPATEELLDLCTQTGASTFCPVFSKFCDVNLLKKWDTKQERWGQIVLASAKQCEIAKIPQILPPLNFEDALNSLKTPALICYEEEQKTPITAQITDGKDVAIFIGPEGGYAEEEIALAKNYGIKPVTLGANILRAQTAAACAVWALANL
ncbi:MAG: 16S rRNA (uracil(1498)-N(3))-methyltransferase [Elusimicrobiaceae bacterium]|nr:16S rRNA (uracil(1498)-N(3))-methyltransferase [Elusimicrobiaceae bacterium]